MLRIGCRWPAYVASRHVLRVASAIVVAACVVACGAVETSDPGVTSLDDVFAIEAPLARARALDRYLASADPLDLPTILERFEAERLRVDVVTGGVLALWWTGFDPAGAFEEGLDRHLLDAPTWASIVVREWARNAPEAALAAVRQALETHGGVDWQRVLAVSAIRGWLDVPGRDIGELLAFVRTLPSGRPQKEALDLLLARKIRQSSVEDAIAFVEGLPNLDAVGRDPLKQDAFNRLATQLAARDPEAAIAWAARHADGALGADLYVRVARRWGREDPPAAIAWAETIPDPAPESAAGRSSAPGRTPRDRALKAVLRNWLMKDAAGARTWVDARPYDARLHPLLELTLVHQTHQGEAEAALERVAAREDVPDPSGLIVAIGQAWRRRDSEAAEAWLARAELAPSVVREIRAPPPRGRRPTRTSGL